MNIKKSALMVAMGLVLAGSAAISGASAETPWQANHRGRVEVNHRLAHQSERIRAERRAGEISGAKAHRLRVADRHVLRQERRMAARRGGHLTRFEHHRLNREENKVSGRIG